MHISSFYIVSKYSVLERSDSLNTCDLNYLTQLFVINDKNKSILNIFFLYSAEFGEQKMLKDKKLSRENRVKKSGKLYVLRISLRRGIEFCEFRLSQICKFFSPNNLSNIIITEMNKPCKTGVEK